jgi:hypothetical protein
MSWYSNYKNVTEKDFREIKVKLDSIERIISPMMQMNGFYLNRISYDENLNLDYIQDYQTISGNIGMTYLTEKSINKQWRFGFYILKAHDSSNRRHYKTVELPEIYSLEQLEKSYIKLFEECLSIYDKIEMSDLTESIELK